MHELKFKKAVFLGAISACFFLIASLPPELEFHSPLLAIFFISFPIFLYVFFKENKDHIRDIYNKFLKNRM